MGRLTVLEKHRRYKDTYRGGELYWGLGIEEETYLQFLKPIYVAAPLLRTNHKAERYSVDYYKSYKTDALAKAFATTFPDSSGFVALPFFLNAYGLQKMDLSGHHTTTYERAPRPNPIFSGRTWWDEWREFSPVLKTMYDISFTFDGDTVEFITQNFYKATVASVITELSNYKQQFLTEVNRFLAERQLFRDRGGSLCFPSVNPGWAVYYSNPTQIAMFNNGTYHLNITVPTFLTEKKENGTTDLLYPDLFVDQHCRCALIYQWLEPLLLSVFGSPDPFASVPNSKFSKASQRCAISRYIGIGTFDTDTMPAGKVLTKPIQDVPGSSLPFWWYSVYHKNSAYEPLKKIGLDINFRKHFHHGLELRWFDWFPEERLQELLEVLIYAADLALTRPAAPQPVFSETWNALIVGAFQQGSLFPLESGMVAMYERILGFPLLGETFTIQTLYERIRAELKARYKHGFCAKKMLAST